MIITIDNLSYKVLNDHEVELVHFYQHRNEQEELIVPETAACRRVVSIGRRAFYECENLRRVVLPPTIRSIKSEAFGLCSKLESINLPDSITRLGKAVFEGSLSLHSVTLPPHLAKLPEALFYDSAISDVTLPENITVIPTACFYDCRNLKCIEIPKTVQHVAHDAFHYCLSLSIVIAPSIDHIDMFDGEKEWQQKPLNHK